MKLKKLLTATAASACLFISFTAFADAPLPTPAATPAQSFNPAQVKEIQSIVHDYLLQDPQLMVQVFQKLQQQQHQNMEQKALNAIHANAKTLFNSPTSPVIGNKNGSVTLVEFFDYQCPHCKEMAKVVEDYAKQDKNLRIVFKEFPIFPGSVYASQAALAANMQGKYFEFHNALMADKNPLTKADVLATAKKIGLDIAKMKKDMNSDAIKTELKQNVDLAQKLGLAGTPAFVVQSNTDKDKTFFVPGQVSMQVLQNLIKKAS